MIILFPSEPFSPKEVDSSFKAEYEAAKLVGFEVFLFDHDEMAKSGNLISTLPYNHGKIETIILRGWMLNRIHYACLQVSLIENNFELINNIIQYINCHHFPEYYNAISKYTSKSSWSPKWEKEAIETARKYMFLDGECDLLIKDYVKSEKGNPDLFILKKELTLDEFHERVEKFVEARGKLFNEGIVLKAVEKLKQYEGQTNEWRMFFLNKQLLILNQNSDSPVKVLPPSKEIVDACENIASKWIDSNFFTMDVAEKEDGSWMILEMGDGQVSGLPLFGDALGFYNKINMMLNKIEA